MITNYSKLIGEKIKKERLRQRLTLRELADKTSNIYGRPISHVSLMRYENNGRSMDVEVLVAICEALGMNMGTMLDEVYQEIKGDK